MHAVDAEAANFARQGNVAAFFTWFGYITVNIIAYIVDMWINIEVLFTFSRLIHTFLKRIVYLLQGRLTRVFLFVHTLFCLKISGV